jgi:ketosteroid isomerase-like protein
MSDQAILARLRAVEDRSAIQDTICAVTINSDLNHPEQALAQFADDAMIDYSSVMGADAAHTPVRKHRERLLTFLPGFDGRQHQVTNFQVQVDGDQATCISQSRAVHFLAGEVWEAWGTYHHKLRRTTDGWKITYQRADLIHQTGEHLVPQATAIVSRRTGGP